MIPKRAAGALLTTVLGLVLLLNFKTPEASGLEVAGGTAGIDQRAGAAPSAPADGVTPTDTATGSTDGSTAAGTAVSPAPPTTETPAGAYVDGTVTGPVVSTRYGDVQVAVTIAGGVVTDVTALQLPDRDGHSSRISEQVEPMLRSMALQAQSGEIDLVSGATYTSSAYRESLQAALDQAAG